MPLCIVSIIIIILYTFVDAPYVDVLRSNRMSGWYFLVVTQPSTSHQLLCMCVCVCALLCLVFIIAVHLGNEVILYQLSPLTLPGTVNSRNATQTIVSPSVPEAVSIREINL